MNILIVHNKYRYRGGEEDYIQNLTLLLKKKGHSVYLYQKDSRDIQYKLSTLIDVLSRFLYSWKVDKELSQIIHSFKPDIAHIQNVYPLIGPTVYYTCRKHKIPIVQTINNYRLVNDPYQSPIYAFVMKISQLILKLNMTYIRRISLYIFPTIYSQKRILDKMNIPKNKTVILPNLNLNLVKKAKIKIPYNNYFLFVGRLSKEKGILQLLEIFKDLPTHKLVVIGTGPLQDIVSTYSNYKNIILEGYKNSDDIIPYYQKALATIMPSDPYFEVCPLVLIESFYAGTPVIAINKGMFQDAIKNGDTGLVYKQNSYDNLKDTILKFAGLSDSKKMRMRKLVIQEYKNIYSQELHYKKLIHNYKKLLNEKN
jgi:glycosyltransferase involved in cell wall biosynthesis